MVTYHDLSWNVESWLGQRPVSASESTQHHASTQAVGALIIFSSKNPKQRLYPLNFFILQLLQLKKRKKLYCHFLQGNWDVKKHENKFKVLSTKMWERNKRQCPKLGNLCTHQRGKETKQVTKMLAFGKGTLCYQFGAGIQVFMLHETFITRISFVRNKI